MKVPKEVQQVVLKEAAIEETTEEVVVIVADVVAFARRNDIPVIAPEDPNLPSLVERVRAAAPDFICNRGITSQRVTGDG